MNITFEERQLMSLYNTGTRTGLIAALEEMRGYLAADETELRELTDSAIAKPVSYTHLDVYKRQNIGNKGTVDGAPVHAGASKVSPLPHR